MAAVGRLKPDNGINKAEGELFAICKDQESAERRSLANPELANTAIRLFLSLLLADFRIMQTSSRNPF